jgi:hypothetical protein
MTLSQWILSQLRKLSIRAVGTYDGNSQEDRRLTDERARDAVRRADARLPPH